MSINLVTNGIFPIVYGKDGNKINNSETGLNIAGTLQGEGKLLGIPSLFIRTSGCNLFCSWLGSNGKGSLCDTWYSSFRPEINRMEIEDIVQIVKNNLFNLKHIVISGGEPTIQPELAELLKQLNQISKYLHITLETNGTIYRDDITPYVNLYSISPKLKNSIPIESHMEGTEIRYAKHRVVTHEKNRKNIEVIQQYIDQRYIKDWSDFQLKFVVTSEADVDEIWEDYLKKLTNWFEYDIILMPEGTTKEGLERSTKIAMEACIRHGWRFTPRLHIDLFGDKRNV